MDVERTHSGRESELAQAQEAVRQIEQAVAEKAAEIDRLGKAVAAVDGAPSEAEPSSHLCFAWTPSRYVLHDGVGEVPVVGSRVTANGHEYAVAKLATSPLPGDARPCAYLEPL